MRNCIFNFIPIVIILSCSSQARHDELIDRYDLQELQNGIYFKEVFRSEKRINEECLTSEYEGDRAYSSSIYYLINSEAKDRFHRLPSDEIWNYYEGSPIQLTVISDSGQLQKIVLDENNRQYVVKANSWYFASIDDSYSFAGLTVTPGFEPSDYEMGIKELLIQQFPQHKSIISSNN